MSSENNRVDFRQRGSVGLFGLDSKVMLCVRLSQMSNQPPLKKSPDKTSTISSTQQIDDLTKMVAELLHRVENGSRSNKGANPDDINIRWCVEITRGEDEAFGKVSGVTTLPGLLTESQFHLSAEKAGTEMINKVAMPVSGIFQDLINQRVLEPDEEPVGFANQHALPNHAADLSFEAEIISKQERSR